MSLSRPVFRPAETVRIGLLNRGWRRAVLQAAGPLGPEAEGATERCWWEGWWRWQWRGAALPDKWHPAWWRDRSLGKNRQNVKQPSMTIRAPRRLLQTSVIPHLRSWLAHQTGRPFAGWLQWDPKRSRQRSENLEQPLIQPKDQYQYYVNSWLQSPRLFHCVFVTGRVFALWHVIWEFWLLHESWLAGMGRLENKNSTLLILNEEKK